MAENINCPYCGKLTDPKLESCPHCGGPLQKRPPRPQTGPPRAGRQCPNCASPVQEGDIICVNCGTNLLTGQRVAPDESGAPRPRRKRRNLKPLLAGAAVLVVVAAVGGALVLYLAQDQVGQARTLAADGNVLEAINLLGGYVEDYPDDAEAQFLLGKLHWRSQQYAQAAGNFQAASSADPANEEAALLSVAALAKLRGAEGLQRQLAALREVAQRFPENQQALYLLALAEGAAGNVDRQIQALERLLNLDPNRAEARRSMGVAQALQGELAEARAQLLEAEAARPGNGDAEAALALIGDLQEQNAQTEEMLVQALEEGSKINALVRTRLGLLYLSEGDYDNALNQLGEAKDSADPPKAAAFFYALALQAAGLVPEALQALDKVASGSGPYAGEASVQMALAYAMQGELQQATQAVGRAMQAGYTSAKVYTIQGFVHAQEGSYEDAIESFRNAVRTDPRYAPAHLELGLQYISRGNLAEGLRELERYLELAGGAPEQRINEIELLVNQLKQTLDQGGAAAMTEG